MINHLSQRYCRCVEFDNIDIKLVGYFCPFSYL